MVACRRGAVGDPSEVGREIVHLLGRERIGVDREESQPVRESQGGRRGRDDALSESRIASPIAGVPDLHRSKAAVSELGEDPTAVRVDPLGETRHGGDPIVVVEAGHAGGRSPFASPDRRRTLHNQADSGLGTRFEFVKQPIDRIVVAGVLQKRRAVEPVRYFESADRDGGFEAHVVSGWNVPRDHLSRLPSSGRGRRSER